MKAQLTFNPDNDVLYVADADNLPRDMVERPYDGPVLKLLDSKTRRQFGWAFYSFSGFFRTGHLEGEGLLPEVDTIYRLDAEPGRDFSLEQLLEWAHEHLATVPT